MDSVTSLTTVKKKRTSDICHLVIIAFFIVFSILSLSASSDLISMIINAAALLIMLGFLLAGMGKIFVHAGMDQLIACTYDLEVLTSALTELNKQQPGLGWQALREQEDFSYTCPELKDAIAQMNDENDALSVDGTYSCDLANYVNENLLSTIGNEAFNDFVSNVMTGLGILGTFIGLAFGLRSFDTSTAEAMTSSIVPLIDGIKVAFYTSIFGVIYSLCYGTFYRASMRDAQQALNNLLDAYYKGMGRHPENEVISRILGYQQSQTENMAQFAENISVALADTLGNVLTPALSALPDQISQSMQQQLSPALDVMETNFNKLTGELSTQLSTAQEQGVEVLIEKFLVGMDQMLNGQVQNLGRTIETICTWQEKTIQHLDEAVSGVCNNAELLQKINTDLESTTTHLDTFTDELKNFQEKSHQTMLETAESFASSVQCVEQAGTALVAATTQSSEITATIQDGVSNITKQEQILRKAISDQMSTITQQSQILQKVFAEQMEAITNQSKEAQTCLQNTAAKQLDSLVKHEQTLQQAVDTQMELLGEGTHLLTNQNEAIKNTGSHLTREFKQTSDEMTSAAKQLDAQLDNALSRSFTQFDSQLAEALLHFSGTLTELQNVVEGTPALVDDVTARMQKETAACLKTMADSQNQFTESIKSTLIEMTAQMKNSVPVVTEKNAH